MARKTKQDWLMAGVTILIESGAQALTIDRLLKQVGVSKGSFYHHFANHADFVTQFLTFYAEEGTYNIIATCDAEATPLKRLLKLIDVVTNSESSIEVAMRAWSQQDQRVKALQIKIDARRLAYLLAQFRPITRNDTLATQLAQLTYSILIGSQHQQPPITGEAQRALFRRALSIYGIVPR